MSCCSSPNFEQVTFDDRQEIDMAAERLARMLAETLEYQEYLRLAGLINLDPDVKRIGSEIRRQQMIYASPGGKSIADLEIELESLPAVQAYRKAEAAVKDLFRTVDQVISSAAGAEFAPNAVNSGCG